MAVYHAKTTGTKTTGASTPDDWTNANCYSTVKKAYDALAASADEDILDDETHAANENMADAGGAYTFTVKSRSSDNTTCIISSSNVSQAALRFVASTTSVVPTIQNIGFTSSVTHTNTNSALLQVSGVVGNMTLENCRFYDVDCDIGNTDTATGALFSSGTTARNWTFTNGSWSGISSEAGERPAFMFIPSTDTVTLTTPTISDCSMTVNNGAIGRGLFRAHGDLAATNINLDDLTFTHTNGGSHFGAFYLSDTVGASLTVTGGTVDNVSINGGGISGIVFGCHRTYNISGIIATGLVATGDTDLNKIGGLCLAIGNNATGTISDCEVSNSYGAFGMGMYWSQGGSGIAKRMNVHDIQGDTANNENLEGLAYYAGGWNNQSLLNSIAYNCIPDNAVVQGSAVYVQVAGNATAAKTFTMQGCTIADNSTSATASANQFHNDNATYALTANATNCIFANGGVREVVVSGTETVTLTLDTCYVQGGQSATTGVDTFTNEQTSDPLLTSDYKLGSNSPAKGAGKFISWQDRDVRGRRRSVPPSLGAYEPTSGDPSDDRTVATTRTVSATRTAATARTAA